jgi:hypothetical protein
MTDAMTTTGNGSVPSAPYRVDLSQGGMSGDVSKQWFSRPADQKFPDLATLFKVKKADFDNSWEKRITTREVELISPTPRTKEDLTKLTVGVSGVRQGGADIVRDIEVAPTHFAFGQMCNLAKAPAQYLRELPAQMVTEQLTYRLRYAREVEEVKFFGDEAQMKAATGPTYGRIPDYQLVQALMMIAGDGLGRDPQFHWKTPGKLNWSNGTYDPEDIGDENDRTFYGSDRDLFCFVVDDRRPIEIGKTKEGFPDLVFRGFYIQNSEVGARSLKLKSFLLRGVCMNRCLWGIDGVQEVIRHTSLAPERWLEQVRPALENYAQGSDRNIRDAIIKVKGAKLVESDDDALAFLQERDFSKREALLVMETHEAAEGRPMRSAWDMAQGITAFAKSKINTDDRLAIEQIAGRLLDKAAA